MNELKPVANWCCTSDEIERQEKIMCKPIKALKLSNGAFNTLMRAHIRTIGDLINYIASDDLHKLRGVGKVYGKEITDKLNRYLGGD